MNGLQSAYNQQTLFLSVDNLHLPEIGGLTPDPINRFSGRSCRFPLLLVLANDSSVLARDQPQLSENLQVLLRNVGDLVTSGYASKILTPADSPW